MKKATKKPVKQAKPKVISKSPKVSAKTKNYKFGKNVFNSYLKPDGNSFEIGFTFKKRNFSSHVFNKKEEAHQWWEFFNNEIESIEKKHWNSNKMPFLWFCNFMNSQLQQVYQSWQSKNNPHYVNQSSGFKNFHKSKDLPMRHSPYFRKVG